MTEKMKQGLLLAFATVVGFVIGYLNPATSQALLSGIGWIAGIGMFFLFRRSNKNPSRDYTASWAYHFDPHAVVLHHRRGFGQHDPLLPTDHGLAAAIGHLFIFH